MAVNGSDWFNNPWNTTFSPYTDLFGNVFGDNAGNVFFLFPLIILTIGIYVKTRNAQMSCMFMIASGALLSAGNLFIGGMTLVPVFVIFTAMGFVGLFISMLMQR